MKTALWLEQECPAHRSRSAEQKQQLLTEAVTAEQQHRKTVRRRLWWFAAGMVACSGLSLLVFRSSPLFSDPVTLLMLFLISAGGYRWPVASRIQRCVREQALARAAERVKSRGVG